MSKFVLIVDLEVKPESIEPFIQAALQQAEQSVRVEPGCHRFDIVRSVDDETRITHYEVFENEDAFEAHAKMRHTTEFASKIQPLIVKVEVRRGQFVTSVVK